MFSSQRPGSDLVATAPLAYVVDDEPQVQAIVCKILASIGFAPRAFAGPLAFVGELRKACPELIVLDLALGQSDAIEVIRILETVGYKGRVLLISGREYAALEEIRRIGERHGLTMLPPVQKPFRGADINNSLASIKQSGREQTSAAEPAPGPSNACQARIDPAEALRSNWLRLWYQAKIDLKSMTVCGAEALLRAKHPELGIIDPSGFLPMKGSAIYQPLPKYVVQQAMPDWEKFA